MRLRGRLVVLAGTLGVLLLAGWGAGELIASWLTPRDLGVVRDVAAWRTSTVTSLARIVSWGGNVVVIGPAAALACIALRRDRRSAAIVGLSTLGAAVIFNVDKLLTGRPRPPVSHLAPVVHSSFPSGHATMSAAFYLALLIVFLSRRHPRIVASVASSVAALAILAVAFARVYLGVHYLSDVAAGALLGAIWAGAVRLSLGSPAGHGPHCGRTPRTQASVSMLTTADRPVRTETDPAALQPPRYSRILMEPRQQVEREPGTSNKPTPWRVEGSRGAEASRPRPPWRGRGFWIVLILLLALNYGLGAAFGPNQARTSVPYSMFRAQVQAGNVADVESRGDEIQGSFRNAVRSPQPGQSQEVKRFQTVRPSLGDDGLLTLLLDKGVAVNAKPLQQARPWWETLLVGFGPTLLLVGLFVLMARRAARAGGGLGGLGGLGRSRAKRYEQSEQRTTFADVAGIDEVKEELAEIVEFLRAPDRFRRLGATIPKGVLLTGLPGTGKTLLARAVAGEAGVPFFSMSASEFIEMVVGVGASRVRDLFEQAKEAAPAIIFIDELDAIGRARGGGPVMGGHDEREQTLNQILTEMDGFDPRTGVIVLAATNRPDILDPALLRPGRFDRRVAVNPPDRDGRTAILEVHTRNVPLADDVDLDQVAAQTPGMVGADLRNLVNEAALTAARHRHERVELSDFTEALSRIILGSERRITLSPQERERTAYHEAGHAILGMVEPGADPVRKVSIVPRGRALGVTFQSPDIERYGYDVAYLRGRITGALGGRAAEELVYGDITTGAESDLEQVTRIARQMVGRWGMSDAIGPVSVLPAPGQEQLTLPGGADALSEATRHLVESETRRIVDECYARALERLGENRARLDRLAAALLEHETLDELDAYRVVGLERVRDGAQRELPAAMAGAPEGPGRSRTAPPPPT